MFNIVKSLELKFVMNKKQDTEFILGDCLSAMDKVLDASIRLVISSPPYNLGKIYERDTKRTLSEYKDWFIPIAEKLVEKISDGGHLCWQSGNYIQNGAIVPLDYLFYEVFSKLGLTLRNRIIWQFNFGLHAKRRFSGRYETLLWFSKGDTYTFNLDAVRVPQIYPGKRHSTKKGARAGTPSGHPAGKNPGDYWIFEPREDFLEASVWNFPNVKANHVEKTIHPCQFPIELAERCVLALTEPGDRVMDPFVGTGTTVVAAIRHERVGVGIDRDPNYINIGKERVASFYNGNLKVRPMGKPIAVPSQGEKVVRRPAEWGELNGKREVS